MPPTVGNFKQDGLLETPRRVESEKKMYLFSFRYLFARGSRWVVIFWAFKRRERLHSDHGWLERPRK